ncbi:MAG: PIN domain protein [Brumimicrobium sp.]
MKNIYVDTSVFGGKFDEEFGYWTQKFFDQVIVDNITLLKSDIVDDELIGAPDFVHEFVDSLPAKIIQHIDLSEEAILLGEQYIKEEVVGRASRADCFHIAIATLQKVDLLVSWNFKHIVNIERIHGYNAVNLKNGFQTLEIRNPREAFDYEDNN